VSDWSPDDYIHHLRGVFRGSGIYKDKTSLNTRCVTITYAGDFYGAKIGDHDSPVSFSRVRLAMIPDRYPAEGRSIGIEIRGNAATDGEAVFWANEPQNLRRQFETQVRARIAASRCSL
jgi:hypothetical protein